MAAQRIEPPAPGESSQAEEAIRRLIAGGHSKAALEAAKELHKKDRRESTEAILIEAYVARIRQLADQKLEQEAKSLWQIVRDRFPAAAAKIGDPLAASPGLADRVREMVRPLLDPGVTPEQRERIEEWLRTNLVDPADLAQCGVLPVDHPLRVAAQAASRALNAVTSRAVTAEELALPEISRRSPLAPWKTAIQAIAAFYRGDDQHCTQHIEAIPAASAASGLAEPLRKLMAGARARSGAKQPSAFDKLAQAVVTDRSDLRKALLALEEEFKNSAPEGRLVRDVRAAVAEAEKIAPGMVSRLKQNIAVRWICEGHTSDRIFSTLGSVKLDASYYRMLALGLETVGAPYTELGACAAWEDFRRNAVTEKWFAPAGPEVGMIYLRIAERASKIPPWVLAEVRRDSMLRKADDSFVMEPPFFAWPERSFELAVNADPGGSGFLRWLEWARMRGRKQAEAVAERWHRERPRDLEPLLELIQIAERKNALQKAAKYVERAEAIDSVHPAVRQGQLRLAMKAAVRHIEQSKPHLAVKDLAAIDQLPQAKQPEKAAVLAAIRVHLAGLQEDPAAANSARQDVERLMGSRMAALFLIAAIMVKGKTRVPLPPPKVLPLEDRQTFPEAMARVCALDIGLGYRVVLPAPYLIEAWEVYKKEQVPLDGARLWALGLGAANAHLDEFAYMLSTAGLALGPAHEPRFLLLRAKALAARYFDRSEYCLRAALELARRAGDAALIEDALEEAGDPEEYAKIAPELLEAVRREEKARPSFPRGRADLPDYEALDPEFGSSGFPFGGFGPKSEDFDDEDFVDEDDMDELPPVPGGLPGFDLPPGIPPMARKELDALLSKARKAIDRGEPLDPFINRALNDLLGIGSARKRRKDPF